MRSFRLPTIVLLLVGTLAGCATPRAAPVVVAPPVATVPTFAGYAGLVVPPRLADGGFATPNRLASASAALWHLRAGLNVAALTCRGPDEAAIIAGYNTLLATHRAEFAASYRALGVERGSGFDDAMTRLYNYYALPPALSGLCEAAAAVLRDTTAVPPGQLAVAAPAALARLDAPYVAVFTRQDSWLASRAPIAMPLIAAAAPVIASAAAVSPILTVDPAIFASR